MPKIAPTLSTARLRPTGLLAECVDYLWTAQGMRGGAEQTLPTASSSLIIKLGDAVWDSTQNAFLRGVQTGPVSLAGGRVVDVVGVQFRPQGAYRLLGIPMHELANQAIALEDLLGDQVHRWRSKLEQEHSLSGRLRCLSQLLTPLIHAANDPLLERAIAGLTNPLDTAPVAQVLHEQAVGNKRLIRLFRQRIGITPKRYARVLRLQGLLASLDRCRADSMARIAAQQGFCDQAHMIRDFRQLTGITPARYTPLYAGNLHHISLKPLS